MATRRKSPPVADKQARFDAYYQGREQRRIARGECSPEWEGILEAREEVQRKAEQLSAMERQFES